jgi:hypothetical protein
MDVFREDLPIVLLHSTSFGVSTLKMVGSQESRLKGDCIMYSGKLWATATLSRMWFLQKLLIPHEIRVSSPRNTFRTR